MKQLYIKIYHSKHKIIIIVIYYYNKYFFQYSPKYSQARIFINYKIFLFMYSHIKIIRITNFKYKI